MRRIIALTLAVLIGSCASAMADTKKVVPFGTRPAGAMTPLPQPRPSAAITVAQAQQNPLLIIQQFTATDLQNAYNDAMRIDATCSGTAANSSSLALTGCLGTPQVGDAVSGTGLTTPVTVAAVGTFRGSSGSITLSSPQTVTNVIVTMNNTSSPPDTDAAGCYTALLIGLFTTVSNAV